MKETNNKILSFAALDQVLDINIIKPTEYDQKNDSFVKWGRFNNYPNYLYTLYSEVTTLQTIINGIVDYVAGNKVKSNVTQLTDFEAVNLIRDIAFSYIVYGGFAINVVKSKLGLPAVINCLDFRNVRSNKKNDVLYYSEDFGKKGHIRGEYTVYPKFKYEDEAASSIYYYKNNRWQTYPLPMWAGSVKDCEIERSIDDYHINNLENGFMGSVLVNLNNGVPNDVQKEEIEKGFNEKFCGKSNAGRIAIAYNNDKDHAATILPIKTDDFSARYDALANRCREQIFTSFRATPNLFGLPTQTTGFSEQEYKSAYKLFNETVIVPIQKIICSAIDTIFKIENSISITPFNINFEE